MKKEMGPPPRKPTSAAAPKANPIDRLGKFAHPPKRVGIINRVKR